jgi:hypothetical protein
VCSNATPHVRGVNRLERLYENVRTDALHRCTTCISIPYGNDCCRNRR